MEERSEAKATRAAPFFFVCAAIVLAWLVSVPLWGDLKSWQAVISTVSSVLMLLLLVLLENASRRAGEATQEELNVVAEALGALMDSHGAGTTPSCPQRRDG